MPPDSTSKSRVQLTCPQCGKSFSRKHSEVLSGRGSTCSIACRVSKQTKGIEDRMLSRRVISPETDCWEWTGAASPLGYGKVGIGHTVYQVHRVSAHLYLGFDLKSELAVCHKCDNPRCFNPDHLFIGTKGENSQDMTNKGRSTFGERNPAAKLTAAAIPQIRALAMSGVHPEVIGQQFGIARRTVSDIVRRIRWRHVA